MIDAVNNLLLLGGEGDGSSFDQATEEEDGGDGVLIAHDAITELIEDGRLKVWDEDEQLRQHRRSDEHGVDLRSEGGEVYGLLEPAEVDWTQRHQHRERGESVSEWTSTKEEWGDGRVSAGMMMRCVADSLRCVRCVPCPRYIWCRSYGSRAP
jgi:hypothetical protein